MEDVSTKLDQVTGELLKSYNDFCDDVVFSCYCINTISYALIAPGTNRADIQKKLLVAENQLAEIVTGIEKLKDIIRRCLEDL